MTDIMRPDLITPPPDDSIDPRSDEWWQYTAKIYGWRQWRHFVYFIGGADLIKIGHADNLPRRYRKLYLMSPVPLEIIRAVPGNQSYERHIHFCLSDARRHGEWFEKSQILMEFIQELTPYNMWRQAGVGQIERYRYENNKPEHIEVQHFDRELTEQFNE